jgi:putative acetyltransferase
MTDTPILKADLLEKIHAARKNFKTIMDGLTDVQLTTPGVEENWSIKDILAHLTAWERLTLERLIAGLEKKKLKFRPIQTDEDVEWMNARVYAINKDRPLADVLDDFRTGHAMLIDKIMSLDKLAIQDTTPVEWAGDRPVWSLIADNTYFHYAEHQEAIEKWLALKEKWDIRPETAKDIPGIRQVEEAAFDRPNEADIVDGIRDREASILSLVAVEGEEIVGHVLFSLVTVTEGGKVWDGVALGPVAVSPSHQKQGLGSLLCREGLAQLTHAGYEFAVVLGHSEYYPRFGFQPSEDYDIHCPWDVPPGVFMVMELQPGALEGVTGMVSYAPEFG